MNNITPRVHHFRFWCQKVLPLVYDNSLSYYEVLCKVGHKLNEVIDFLNNYLLEEIHNLIAQYFVDISYDEATETIILKLEDNE